MKTNLGQLQISQAFTLHPELEDLDKQGRVYLKVANRTEGIWGLLQDETYSSYIDLKTLKVHSAPDAWDVTLTSIN